LDRFYGGAACTVAVVVAGVVLYQIVDGPDVIGGVAIYVGPPAWFCCHLLVRLEVALEVALVVTPQRLREVGAVVYA